MCHDLKVWDFTLLLLLGYNVLFGYNKDEERFNQMTECMKEICDKQSPSTVPLFRENAASMVQQLEKAEIKIVPCAKD